MSMDHGRTLPKMGDWVVIVCRDTTGRHVRAAVTVKTAITLTCECVRVTAECPGPAAGYSSEVDGRTGCTAHPCDVETIPAGQKVVIRDGFLYTTDEPAYATDPATLIDIAEFHRIRVEHPGGVYVMEVTGVHRDEYGINYSGAVVEGEPGRDPFASSRSDHITKV